ncbi:B12-binding domain-containing radical SAM protein [bacterium]|nr:B12-binding domain-containing radical SAM protein [candidate division CSSED10-310 bacterium]
MRVLLAVAPPKQTQSKMPDLGLGYLATALRKSGHQVAIYQGETDESLDRFLSMIREFRPALLGLKIFSLEVVSARESMEAVRTEFPDMRQVIGGPHVSIMQIDEFETLFPAMDFAIRGEGEIPLPMLADALDNRASDFRHIPGIVYRHGESWSATPPVRHPNLDDFGMPAWDLMDPRKYTDRWFFWNPAEVGAPIITSRGCPYRCSFCAQNIVGGKRLRQRSLANVLDELDLLINQFGMTDFEIMDDNFMMNMDFVTGFCRGIINRGWKITWSCGGSRLDNLDLPTVRLMEQAGCTILSVGLESGSQRVLDYMCKDLRLETVRVKTAMITRNSSIKIHAMFILGYPTETRQDILKTIAFAKKLDIFAATFFTFLLLPGSPEFARLLDRGEITNPPFRAIRIDSHIYAPQGMTLKELKRLYHRAFLSFYLRPHVLWRIFRATWHRIPVILKNAIRKWHF